MGRTLHPNPDRIVEARLSACPHCAAPFPDEAQTPQQVYERIELPPVKPDVTQVRLFGGRCACCNERATAQAPAGLEQGSPFGQSIAAMVVYLHYAHAIGMARLITLMGELFGLSDTLHDAEPIFEGVSPVLVLGPIARQMCDLQVSVVICAVAAVDPVR